MKFTAKLFLALAFVASFVLTSCKDDNEDNYQNAIAKTIDLSGILGKVENIQKQLDDLKTRTVKDCMCSIVENSNGTVTISAGGKDVTMNKVDFTPTKDGILIGNEVVKFGNEALKDAGFTTDADGAITGIKLPSGGTLDFNTLRDAVTAVMEDGKFVGIKYGTDKYVFPTVPAVKFLPEGELLCDVVELS